jgi:gliding motility-associated-like protein
MSIDPDPEDVDRYCLRDTVILEATADSDLTGASYQWFVNGIAQEGLDTSVIAVVLEGPDPTIEFEVEVTDNNGCIGSVIREVTFEPCTEVEVPNVFTPNGDGTNDFFNLVSNNNIGSIGDDVEVLEFKIWNRWGSLVYDNDNPTMGWDGTNGGDPAPSEVYVYQIVYRKLPEAEEFVVSGDVTLVR